MTARVHQIAACAACGRAAVDDVLCCRCLRGRAPRWLELHCRVQRDPEFALAVFEKLGPGRVLFLRLYGLPRGAAREPGDA